MLRNRGQTERSPDQYRESSPPAPPPARCSRHSSDFPRAVRRAPCRPSALETRADARDATLERRDARDATLETRHASRDARRLKSYYGTYKPTQREICTACCRVGAGVQPNGVC
eukprot:3457270-Prymnesium_polylepis.4